MDNKRIFPENPGNASAENAGAETKTGQALPQDNEPNSLAFGLPSWSIEPPAVVVRRKARSI
jgi:hypothetical protein